MSKKRFLSWKQVKSILIEVRLSTWYRFYRSLIIYFDILEKVESRMLYSPVIKGGEHGTRDRE